jgi:Kef-type K+ transport system membrane component KefB
MIADVVLKGRSEAMDEGGRKMLKRAGVVLTMLIFIPIFGGFGYLYWWIFSRPEFPRWVSILIVIGSVALISAFIAAAIQRFKEINKEDESDLSKY